jgi:MFS family permease
VLRGCLLAVSVACALLWFPQSEGGCIDFEHSRLPCFQIVVMIALVCGIKFFNSILFTVLITYSSEAFPTPVRSLGYGFTITFGRMSTFLAPFFVDYIRSQDETRNALCYLFPLGFIGFYLCLLMPNHSNISENLIEEEEETKMRPKDIEMTSMPQGSTPMRPEHL